MQEIRETVINIPSTDVIIDISPSDYIIVRID